MNGTDVLSSLRHELAERITTYQAAPFEPLSISPWLAMALLQKSIRRGQWLFAIRAAATLAQLAPEKLWRRLGVIAFEDIGVADLDTVCLTVASLGGKKFRTLIGGEWKVVSFIVQCLIDAPKCRAADDLLLTAERHPANEQARLQLTYEPISKLMSIAAGDAPLPIRALAIWYGIGTDRYPSEHLRMRRGEPHAVFDAMCEAGLPHTLVEVAREGFRKTNQVLCPLLPMIFAEKIDEPAVIRDDQFPPETTCGPVPSWAIDVYSQAGRQALQALLARDGKATRWVRQHVPPARRVKFLGSILFAVEGGACSHRLRWSVGEELRRLSEIEAQGPYCKDATEIIGLLRADIPLLNEVRRHVQ